jgi:hypothetical protein
MLTKLDRSPRSCHQQPITKTNDLEKTVCEDKVSNASIIEYMLLAYLLGDHTHILILQRSTMARSGI